MHYPIRAVSRLTGLSIDTLRAWERRYQAIVPERTDRGRQYTQDNVQRLILLRELVERGHAISQVAKLPGAELWSMLAAAPPAGRRAAPTVSVDVLMDAFANFEHTKANDELGRLAALLSPRDLIFNIALPLMREVGECWHNGDIGIAQEHLASAAVRNLFGSLVRLSPPRPGAPRILLSTLPDELHEFGILAAAMIATISGMNPLLLGPNLPVEEVVFAAHKTSAAVVVIGCSGGAGSPDQLERLAATLPSGVELWIGGCGTSVAIPRAVLFTDMEGFERACMLRGLPVQ